MKPAKVMDGNFVAWCAPGSVKNDSFNGTFGGQKTRFEVGADNPAYGGEQNLSYQCTRPFIRVK